MDPVDFFAAVTKRAWLIKRKWRSTGAPPANACWPTRKWSTASASGAAARSCSKVKSQWMLKITEYAQRLVDDLDTVDYIDRVKVQQKNWIGRSTGAEVDFRDHRGGRSAWCTPPGRTRCSAPPIWSFRPEHPYIEKWAGQACQLWTKIRAYQRRRRPKIRF